MLLFVCMIDSNRASTCIYYLQTFLYSVKAFNAVTAGYLIFVMTDLLHDGFTAKPRTCFFADCGFILQKEMSY